MFFNPKKIKLGNNKNAYFRTSLNAYRRKKIKSQGSKLPSSIQTSMSKLNLVVRRQEVKQKSKKENRK